MAPWVVGLTGVSLLVWLIHGTRLAGEKWQFAKNDFWFLRFSLYTMTH